MKVTCKTTQKDVQYPCLVVMSNTKRIVLMTSANVGVCVCNPEGVSNDVGHYSTKWYSHTYNPYSGVVTLQND